MDALELRETAGELHETLAELLDALGAPSGVGREDQAAFDRAALIERELRLQAAFRRHESCVGLRRIPSSRALMIDAQHRTIRDLLTLLGAVTQSCDCHVHGLRFVLTRLEADIEAHLAFEEELP